MFVEMNELISHLKSLQSEVFGNLIFGNRTKQMALFVSLCGNNGLCAIDRLGSLFKPFEGNISLLGSFAFLFSHRLYFLFSRNSRDSLRNKIIPGIAFFNFDYV